MSRRIRWATHTNTPTQRQTHAYVHTVLDFTLAPFPAPWQKDLGETWQVGVCVRVRVCVCVCVHVCAAFLLWEKELLPQGFTLGISISFSYSLFHRENLDFLVAVHTYPLLNMAASKNHARTHTHTHTRRHAHTHSPTHTHTHTHTHWAYNFLVGQPLKDSPNQVRARCTFPGTHSLIRR